MKIAFVSDAIWPFNKGGKEKRLFDIATRLAQEGSEIHIYTMKWWQGPNQIKKDGLHLHAIAPLMPLYSGSRRSIKEGLIFGVCCLRLVGQNWEVVDVDHMPFFPVYFVKLVCLLKGKKMIATWHEVWGKKYWLDYLGILGNVAYLIEKMSVRLPDKILSVSEHTTNRLKTDFMTKTKVLTIPDGIDLGHIKNIPPSKVKSDVVFAGRLLKHKNVQLLIQSIALLKSTRPDIRCLIVGDGPDRNRLEEMVIKLNLKTNILFLGFLENHDDLYSLIKSTKVFVLPSLREGFGIVVTEAFACKTPVITVDSRDNAAKDLIVENVNGLLAKPNQDDLAKKILQVLDGPKRMEAKNGVENYDWEIVMQKIKHVFINEKK